jgi:transposase InsO family protein
MSIEKHEVFMVRLNGKNYSAWEFQFSLYVQGKDLWGHVDDTTPAPDKDKDKDEHAKWKTKDAQVMTWITSSVDPTIVLNLRPYKTAATMWAYLKKIYGQNNAARRFQLEHDIANFKQDSLSISDFYSQFMNLWAEYTDIVYSNLSADGLSAVQTVHDTTKRDQFLMKLRYDFEGMRSSLMHRDPIPSLDACLHDLLREEQRLLTQSILEEQKASTVPVAYVAQGRSRNHDMSTVQCFCCKRSGHYASNCPNKFCNYCKKDGHIIKECPTRPPKRNATAFATSVDSSIPTAVQQNTPTAVQTLTPEMVQQMIISAFSALGFSGKSCSPWYFDSGASNHMTNNTQFLNNITKYSGNLKIHTADGNQLPITATGDISSTLTNVFVSPGLTSNLISVGQLVDNNCKVQFTKSGCLVQDQHSGMTIAKGPKVGRLFPLNLQLSPSLSLPSVLCNSAIVDYQVWHKRLGHPNFNVLHDMLKSGFLGNKHTPSLDVIRFDCIPCKLGKSKILPFPTHQPNVTQPFDLIHSDVWGVAPIISHANYKYFVTFIDDYSRFTWVYFLRSKDEVFSTFKFFNAYVQTQFSSKIKILRSDNGGEYTSNFFQEFLQSNGIISQRSCPSTPQQNGVAERKNRHLLDVVRTLFLESHVPPRFWCEALSTAVHLINSLSSPSINNESPFSRLFGKPPDYSTLRVFGCVCYVHLPPQERTKLSAQSVECGFLGYSSHQKGFLCYDPNNRRIRVSRNVIFQENKYFFATHHVTPSTVSLLPFFSNSFISQPSSKPLLTYQRRCVVTQNQPADSHGPPQDSSLAADPIEEPEPDLLRRSSRIRKPPEKYGFSSPLSLTATLSSVPIPSSYKQAMEHGCWQTAIENELLALEENQTWDIVPCPPSVKPLGSKFVFSIKLRSDGSIDRYKARLVVLGNKQEYGLDYDETFAPVAKMTSVRTILALAASQSWPLHQMDVKNAFLHGDLKEEVYMKLPNGMPTSSSNTVCKLKRSLYGLKQAPRVWFEKFRSTLLGFSFIQSQYDPSLFLQRTAKGIVVLLVYVDDIVVTGSDQKGISKIRELLHSSFHMKELGRLTYFLGLEVHYQSEGIFLNQQKYIKDLVQLAGLTNSNSVDTPMEVNVKYRRDEGELLDDPTLYRKLVGSLIYVTITRPDISFAVHTVSRFMQAPRHLHFSAVQRIIKYLLGTSRRGLFFPNNSTLQLQAYSDADWAGCPDTRKSTTGWCMFLGNAAISWKCKKQDSVSKSSTEAEYRAMSAACSEIVWLRGLLTELGFSQGQPTSLHADNTSAIQIAANPVYHERTKHIEVDCHSIREAYDRRIINLPHVSTSDQTADIFTKSLTRQRHNFLVSKLMLVDLPASI